MALKYKLNKSQYDALSDDLKAEYIAGDADGEFLLDVSGIPAPEDTGPLKRALESEKTKTKTLKNENDTLKAKIADTPDIEAITATHKAETAKLRTFAEKTLIDGAANALAAKISKAPALLIPHIKARLVADMTGDDPVTKVLGADGKPSDLTIDKLGEEFVANKDFSAIMIASKASGGGAPQTPVRPLGGGAPKDGEQQPDLSKASPADLAARITARREAQAQQQ